MPPQVLKPSSIKIHRRHGHQNTQPFRNLITSNTDSLSSLISFSNCDITTVYYIIVRDDATNMSSGTGSYRLGTAVDLETA